MKETIQSWYAWLKEAASTEKKELEAVYSDGRQLWATDGYRIHVQRVTLEKKGTVSVNEEGLFVVEENSTLPDFTAVLPRSEAKASIVVERDTLLKALAGQDKHVRLTLFNDDISVELSSAGAYALVMPIGGLDEDEFWQPETEEA